MYSIKNNILYFILLIAVFEVQSLVELREEDKDLAVTEAAVRKTVNSIFSMLHLHHSKYKAKFGEFAAIHNFFVTITIQDDDNLKKLANLARVDGIDNNTQHFITQINEVLNEDNKSNEPVEDEYVTAHIDTFIRKLEYLKFKYGFASNDAKLGISTQVLKHLKSDDNLQNGTQVDQDVNESDDLLGNDEFWNPGASRRIFQGRKATITRFPFMASVQFFKKFQCGGSIIKSDLVITSASCLQLAWNNRFFRENPAFLSVQVGCDLYEGGDENIPILEVYFHPEYNPKNLKNNLAIMRLVRVLKFGRKIKNIKKINFDRQPYPLSEHTPGITIIGWGARHTSNLVLNIWKNRLAYAVLDYYPLRDCQEIYSKEFVSNKNFCAGFISKGGGACNRDAGGPGVAGGKLMGVVSFGAPNCGAPDAPTVFTKLGYYTDWIEGILEMQPPTGGRSTTPRPTRQVYDANSFVMSTKNEFVINPITKSPLREAPIPSSDALRSLDENDIFKEFIKTMFGEEEVKDYLDQFESNSDKSVEATTREVGRAITVKPTTEPTIKADSEEDSAAIYQKGSVKAVTIIDNFEELKVQSKETEETMPMSVELIPEEDFDEEVQAEQNIARLIDDIDIQDLLASDKENEKSSTEDIEKSSEAEEVAQPEEPKQNIEKTTPSKPKNVRIKQKIEEEETIESTVEITLDGDDGANADSNNDGLYDDTASDQSQSKVEEIVEIETKAKAKVKKAKKDKKDRYVDATFRQNSTQNNGILDIFSRDALLKLFHEAVADAKKQNALTATTATTTTTTSIEHTTETEDHYITQAVFERRESGLSIPID